MSTSAAAENRRGIAAICGAMFVFVLSDVLLKLVSGIASTGQIMAVRGVVAAVILGVALVVTTPVALIRQTLSRFVALRSTIDGVSTACFLTALKSLPLADAIAIVLATPLMLAPLSALLLGERVGPRRWIAVAIGFGGVVLVLNPGGGALWQADSLFAVACAGLLAVRELMTRQLPVGVPSLGVSLASSLSIMLVGFGFMAVDAGEGTPAWPPLSAMVVAMLIGAGVFNAIGTHLNTVGFRIGQVSAVAPFRYTTIPWALVAGVLVWGDTPTAPMLIGTALILGSGLIVLRGERKAEQSSG